MLGAFSATWGRPLRSGGQVAVGDRSVIGLAGAEAPVWARCPGRQHTSLLDVSVLSDSTGSVVSRRETPNVVRWIVIC